MKRTFNYEDISIKDIENNHHLIFISDGDKKEVIIEREETNEQSNFNRESN